LQQARVTRKKKVCVVASVHNKRRNFFTKEAYIIVTKKNKKLHYNLFFPHKKFTLQNNITWLLVMTIKRAFVLKHGTST